MAKKVEELNGETPRWFIDWHNIHFLPVRARSKRNERLTYILLASVLVFNTVGNYYHDEIFQFIMRLFS